MDSLASIAAALLAFATMAVLPGFGVAAVLRRAAARAGSRTPLAAARAGAPGAGVAESLVLAIAWSSIAIAAIGAGLLAFGWFSSTAVALAALVLSVAGAPSLLRWSGALRRAGWTIAFVLALAAPWAVAATEPGYAPAQTFQWYYWLLGVDLDAAGGIPLWVGEYGAQVRWLPDYVLFNLVSEGYRGLMPVDDPTAMTAWQVPLVVATLALVYAVLRLWVSRPAAFAGTGATAATTFFLVIFGSYKPESLGVALGLCCVWLVVRGLRDGLPGLLLLAGAVLGVAAGTHPIAATVLAMLAAAAGVAEIATARDRRAAAFGLACVALCALAVTLALGLVLQGRPLVAADTANPELVDGSDLTWEVLRASEGAPRDDVPPPLSDRLADTLRLQWPEVGVGQAGWLMLPLLAGTVLAAVLGGHRQRLGVGALLGALVLLAVAATGFALAFETYVPRQTGITRLAPYGSLLAGLLVAFALEGYLLLLGRRAPRPAVIALAVGLVTVGWTIPTAVVGLSSGTRISEQGLAALDALGERARDGEGVLANASTRGSIELLTGLDAPLEGRQPVLEEPDVLALANEHLERAHRFFNRPRETSLLDAVEVRWIVATERPRELGAQFAFGDPAGSIARLRRSSAVQEVWAGRQVAIFRSVSASGDPPGIGPARTAALAWTVATVVLALVFAACWRLVGRPARRAR